MLNFKGIWFPAKVILVVARAVSNVQLPLQG